MLTKIDLSEEPYFGLLFRGLRHWRALHPRRSSLTESASQSAELLKITASIVAAYVKSHSLPASGLVPVIEAVHKMVVQLAGAAPEPPSLKPAVPIRRSVANDYIVCLEDGNRLKMLKRYLRTRYNLSPEEYRARWGLPADYPLVAPNYAARRSEFAKRSGLGRRAGRHKRRKLG